MVVGFYDNLAVRTPDGWRLSSITLTATHQENDSLRAATLLGEFTGVLTDVDVDRELDASREEGD